MYNKFSYRTVEQQLKSKSSSRETSVASSSATSSTESECSSSSLEEQSSSSSTQSPSSELLYDYMELSFSNNPDSYSSYDNGGKIKTNSNSKMYNNNSAQIISYYGITTSNPSTVETTSTEADEFYDAEWQEHEQEQQCHKSIVKLHTCRKQREHDQQQKQSKTKETANRELRRHKSSAKHSSEIIDVLSIDELNTLQLQNTAVRSAITPITITEDNSTLTKSMLTFYENRDKNIKDKSYNEHQTVQSNEQLKRSTSHQLCEPQQEQPCQSNRQHIPLIKVADNSTITSQQSSLQLISQHFVAQSAFTERNPFRTQTFAEFCAHPEYSPPHGFQLYSDAVKDVVYHGYTIAPAMEGEYLTERLLRYALVSDTLNDKEAQSTTNSHLPSSEEQLQRISTLRNQLFSMHRGTWLYKWTRTNHVHRRFVWLDLQVGEIMWSRSPHSWLVKTQLRIAEIVDIIPDTISNSINEKVFYRFVICTSTRRLYFATELLDKFKMWFTILRQLTESNTCDGIPGIGSRPSSKVYGNQGAISRWALRYSPLQALMSEEETQTPTYVNLQKR